MTLSKARRDDLQTRRRALIASYQRAFGQAFPEKTKPTITIEDGWFVLADSEGKWRRLNYKDMEAARDTLLKYIHCLEVQGAEKERMA